MPWRPTFIVGTGRCGSTLVSDMLQEDPRVLSISEWFTVLGEQSALEDRAVGADAFWRLLTSPSVDNVRMARLQEALPELRIPEGLAIEAGTYGIAPILLVPVPRITKDYPTLMRALNRHLGEQPLPATLPEWHTRAFAFLANRYRQGRWIERSGGSLAYIESIHKAWPTARYIHIYRDGIACSQSMATHPYFRVRVARAVRRAPIAVDDCLRTEVPLHQFGAYWSAVVARGCHILQSVGQRDVLHLNYEHLLESPLGELRRIQAFLQLEEQTESWMRRAAALVRKPGGARRPNSPSDIERLHRTCAPGMRLLASLPRG